MDANDRRDIEIELVELLDKFLDPRARRHLAVSRADVVGFDKQLFLGQIYHDQVCRVGGRKRMNLDPTRTIGENPVPAAERFDDHGPLAALQIVGIARVRRTRNFLIECPGVEGYDDRRAFRHKRANPPGVIQMVVGGDRIADRLFGEPLLYRLDHGRRAGFVQRTLNGDQMITHLD